MTITNKGVKENCIALLKLGISDIHPLQLLLAIQWSHFLCLDRSLSLTASRFVAWDLYLVVILFFILVRCVLAVSTCWNPETALTILHT